MSRHVGLVIGVWKDKLVPTAARQSALALKDRYAASMLSYTAAVAPAPVSLAEVSEILGGSQVKVVAQDVHWPDPDGSYIGSTSVRMLVDLGIEYAMVGHSERRRFFCESNADVRRKVVACQDAGIHPIVCVGDATFDLAERRRVLDEQIGSLLKLGPEQEAVDTKRLTIAYEPIWAISTWRNDRPLPDRWDVIGFLSMLREIVQSYRGQSVDDIRFLYGGSVNAELETEYFASELVEGALIGAASLQAQSLISCFDAATQMWSE